MTTNILNKTEAKLLIELVDKDIIAMMAESGGMREIKGMDGETSYYSVGLLFVIKDKLEAIAGFVTV